MVIIFLDVMSILFSPLFVQSNTPAQYLIIILTTRAFIPAITFPSFNCGLSNFFTLLTYSLFTFSFIFLFMMESNCNTPKNLYPSRFTPLISFPSGNLIPSVRTIFPPLQEQHRTLVQTKYHTNIIIKNPHGLDKRIQFSLTLCIQLYIVHKQEAIQLLISTC